MSESSGEHVAEKAPKPAVFVAYRENDLYKEYVPRLINRLRNDGYVVETHAFPKGTPPEQIAAWWNENQASVQGKCLFLDNTVESQIGSANCRSLDEAFVTAAEEVLTEELKGVDKRHIDEMFSPEETEKLLTRLFHDAYEHDKPAKVYVFERSLEDHKMFGEWVKPTREEEATDIAQRMVRILAAAGVPSEATEIISFRHDRIREAILAERKNRGEGWGLSEEEIAARMAEPLERYEIGLHHPVGNPSPEEMAAMGAENAWIISDRHNVYGSMEEAMTRARLIQLPLSNLIFSLVSQGLLSMSTESFEERLVSRSADSLSKAKHPLA